MVAFFLVHSSKINEGTSALNSLDWIKDISSFLPLYYDSLLLKFDKGLFNYYYELAIINKLGENSSIMELIKLRKIWMSSIKFLDLNF
ncbi:MAG: hypothetical protein MHPSP_003745, partial [Paramarteilia canceri]